MADFKEFRTVLNNRMDFILENSVTLLETDIDTDFLWESYLKSFSPKNNPVYRKRTEHDCQCCKKFIKTCGSLVGITKDFKTLTIWEVEIPGKYQKVADSLDFLVKKSKIENRYRHFENVVGVSANFEHKEGVIKKWDHFYYSLPDSLVTKNLNEVLGDFKTDHEVFVRGLKDLKQESLELVIALIKENSIYRGKEHLKKLEDFLKIVKEKETVPEEDLENFLWCKSLTAPKKLRNSVIGSLVLDLSEGMSLERAVKKFENKTAPENYQRPSALVTPGMLKKAKKTLTDLGFLDSMQRRFAVKDDIPIEEVLFVNDFTERSVDPFDILEENLKKLDLNVLTKAKTISAENFFETILPGSEGLEILLEKRLEPNLVSLVTSVKDSPNIFGWGNQFSWSYNNNLTDSLKVKVQEFGGETEGVLRYTIQWNGSGQDNTDLDIQCWEPSNYHLSFKNKEIFSPCFGKQDVDVINPMGKIAVENILWKSLAKMTDGVYVMGIQNYSTDFSEPFCAEIEFEGEIYRYPSEKGLRGKELLKLAQVSLEKGRFSIKPFKTFKIRQEILWGLSSRAFHKVNLICNSPNFWGKEEKGHKHVFFMLEGCNSEQETRGFYNEFLNKVLIKERKTMELLGQTFKVPKSANQISGLGFSTTEPNFVYCKLQNNIYKIIF